MKATLNETCSQCGCDKNRHYWEWPVDGDYWRRHCFCRNCVAWSHSIPRTRHA